MLVFALLVWALERQVFGRSDLSSMADAFLLRMHTAAIWPLVLAVLLVPINWAMETEKWRRLMRRSLPLTFVQAYRAILAGVTFSLFTPNRIGEYGGRLLVAGRRHGVATVLATVVSSLGQWLVLLGFGLLGFLVFALRYMPDTKLLIPDYYLLLAVVLFLPGFWLYFNLGAISNTLRSLWHRYPVLRFLRVFAMLRHYRRPDLLRVLALSVLRYGVYVLQYALLLHFFGVVQAPLAALAGIATLYLLQTCLPLPPVVALVARGELALLIWSGSCDQPLLILACTFALFILNLSIPALLGAVVIVQTNVQKTRKHAPQTTVSKLLQPASAASVEPGFISKS